MIPNPNEFKEKTLSEFRKAFESALLKSKFLYSTAVERPLEEDDFNFLVDDTNILASTIVKKIFCRTYLALTHREQKKLLQLAVKRNEEIVENLDDLFSGFEVMADGCIEKMEAAESEKDILIAIVDLGSKLINVFRGYMYDRIKNIPAALFKKITLALYEDEIDLTFMVELIEQEMNKRSEDAVNKLVEQYTLQELMLRGVQAHMQGDIKALQLIQKAIEKKEELES